MNCMGDPLPDTSRIKCRRCSAMILHATARIYGGYCATCSRTGGFKYRAKVIGSFLVSFIGSLGGLFLLPFILVYLESRRAWRTWRFPFDRPSMLQAIRVVHPCEAVARFYLDGVIDGYWDNAPPSQLLTRNLPRQFGSQDGGQLRRDEIKATDIPTHHGAMTLPVNKTGTRYMRV